MSRTLWRIVVCGALLLPVAACSSGPVAPSGGFDGTWLGTLSDSASGSGSVKLVLSQAAAGVSGTFAITFADSSQNRSGTAGGTAAAPLLVLSLVPAAPLVCSGGVTLTGTLSATMTMSGNRMSGSYSSFTCGGAIGGTLDVSRQ